MTTEVLFKDKINWKLVQYLEYKCTKYEDMGILTCIHLKIYLTEIWNSIDGFVHVYGYDAEIWNSIDYDISYNLVVGSIDKIHEIRHNASVLDAYERKKLLPIDFIPELSEYIIEKFGAVIKFKSRYEIRFYLNNI